MLNTRVPLWVPLALVLVGAILFGAYALTREETDLGATVRDAERIEATVLLCNEIVDDRDINPRDAELDLQRKLTDEGAQEARVRVERQDCGASTARDG